MNPQGQKALIRSRGRVIESRTQRVWLFLARLIVGLAGLVFFFIAFFIVKAGIETHSPGLAAVGSLLALSALALIWAGFTSNGRDVCEAAVILLISG